jgi:hypothetical protein
MRNLAVPNVAGWDLLFDFSTGIPGPAWMDCLFITEEKATLLHPTFGPISRMRIAVSRQGSPDLETYSVHLNLTADVLTRSVEGSGARSFLLRESVRLQAASLSRYPIVLRHLSEDSATPGAGTAVAGPQLSSSSQARIEILGSVYRAGNKGSTASLDEVLELGSLSRLSVHGRLDLQADALSLASVTSLSLAALSESFRMGIKEKVFSGVSALPIQDGLPSAYTPNSNGAWNQYIQYPTNPARRHQPIGYVSHVAMDAVGVPAFDTSETFSTAIPSAPWSDSCDTSSRKIYVHVNFDRDVTLNDTHFGVDNSFCGWIAANSVVIDVGTTSDKLFLGQIIARKIRVNGTRTLIVASPFENLAISNPSPTPSLSDVRQHFEQIALLQGQNFRVPVLANAASLAAPPFQAYRPHGAVADASLWLSGAFGSPVASTYPPAGYMVRCEDDGLSPQHFCPRITAAPASLTRADREAALNSGLMDQLVFE